MQKTVHLLMTKESKQHKLTLEQFSNISYCLSKLYIYRKISESTNLIHYSTFNIISVLGMYGITCLDVYDFNMWHARNFKLLPTDSEKKNS